MWQSTTPIMYIHLQGSNYTFFNLAVCHAAPPHQASGFCMETFFSLRLRQYGIFYSALVRRALSCMFHQPSYRLLNICTQNLFTWVHTYCFVRLTTLTCGNHRHGATLELCLCVRVVWYEIFSLNSTPNYFNTYGLRWIYERHIQTRPYVAAQVRVSTVPSIIYS